MFRQGGLTSLCISMIPDTNSKKRLNPEPLPLLPEDSRLQPIDAAVERQLEAMLQAETFEKVMLDALRPQVSDSGILHPGVFHAMRGEVLDVLQTALAQETDPAALEDLHAALELLQHLGQAHELGEQYRYALLKG